VAETAELRLALVCYGGVSLAVYMYGVTNELHKLVRAAREFDTRRADNPFAGGTEAVYFDTLRDIEDAGRRLVVSVDIIGGTSAGGINGIALSKALACNAGLETLKKVWIEEDDIRQLLRGPAWVGLPLQALVTVIRQLNNLFGPSSPLRGEYMSKLLLNALTDMDKEGIDGSSLLPNTAGGLELFVTATDLNGFDVLVPSGAGGASQRDRYYGQVLEFRRNETEQDEFGKNYTADLAFAGRATSSFPGAFAPISQRSFKTEVGQDVDLHPDKVFRYPYGPENPADDVYFVDGGVLDNAPFDLVIDAISRRRADNQVHRRLIYIEPDPGRELYSKTREAVSPQRRWLTDLLAVSTVRGSHPILVDLIKLRDMNWRIAEVNAIAEQQETYVEDTMLAALTDVQLETAGDAPTQSPAENMTTAKLIQEFPTDKVRAVSDKLHARAQDALGPAWATYQRLKFEAVLARLANDISESFGYPGLSGKAGFVTAGWIAWARRQPAWTAAHTEALGGLLRATDMPYRERRLAFILAGINALYDAKDKPYPPPPAKDLNAVKSTVWEMTADIRTGTNAAVAQIPRKTLEFLRINDDDAVRTDPEQFARDNGDHFKDVFDRYAEGLKPLCNDSAKLLDVFQGCTAEWTPDARKALLSRYLGFPLWDGILFPTISLTELPQLTPIEVTQFSPLMANALKAFDQDGKETDKLKGIPVKHFAAFFAAEPRENDYLWGRLDGAELILRMLHGVATQGNSSEGEEPASEIPRLADALRAVLDTESGLKRVNGLRKSLGGQIDKLGRP
jgi:patatin-related protein